MATELTTANFAREVVQSDVPVLVDFWAPWCGPCRMQMPVIDRLARTAGESFRVFKVNVDEEPELARRYGVSSIPTLMVFRSGETAARFTGVQSERTLREALQGATAAA